jgi:hypothetical protein
MTAPDSQPKSVRSGAVTVLLSLICAVFLAAALAAIASRFFRPFRLPNGEWVIAILTPTEVWKTGPTRTRYLWCCTDLILRQEWDLDGDGRFDCREDECGKRTGRWAMCVSRRVDGRWVPEPYSVDDCGVDGEGP